MNKKKLILSGGGDASDSKVLDKLLLKLVPENGKILYIPVAWKDSLKTGGFKGCREWFSSTFSNLGFNNFEMWVNLKEKRYTDLESFEAMYIGGGNTFYLVHLLRETGFLKILEKFIKSGRPVYGGSAGAIILGKSIKTASFGKDSDENFVNLEDLSGLNLIKGYSIQCHYEKEQDKETMKFSKKNNLPVVALPESSGLYVENGKIEVTGFKSVVRFKDEEKDSFKPGFAI